MTNAFALPFSHAGKHRKFFKDLCRGALAVSLAVCVVLAGCSFASFTAAAEEDIPVVEQMITNITNVVAPGVSAEIQVAGGLALASLQILCGTPALGASKCDPTSLVGQYQLAVGTAKTTILQKIDAALMAVNTHVNAMLALAKGLAPSIGAAIVTAVGLVLSTVTALLTLIPQAIALSSGTLGVSLTPISYPPRASSLKKAFNQAVNSQWPGAAVK